MVTVSPYKINYIHTDTDGVIYDGTHIEDASDGKTAMKQAEESLKKSGLNIRVTSCRHVSDARAAELRAAEQRGEVSREKV